MPKPHYLPMRGHMTLAQVSALTNGEFSQGTLKQYAANGHPLLAGVARNQKYLHQPYEVPVNVAARIKKDADWIRRMRDEQGYEHTLQSVARIFLLRTGMAKRPSPRQINSVYKRLRRRVLGELEIKGEQRITNSTLDSLVKEGIDSFPKRTEEVHSGRRRQTRGASLPGRWIRTEAIRDIPGARRPALYARNAKEKLDAGAKVPWARLRGNHWEFDSDYIRRAARKAQEEIDSGQAARLSGGRIPKVTIQKWADGGVIEVAAPRSGKFSRARILKAPFIAALKQYPETATARNSAKKWLAARKLAGSQLPASGQVKMPSWDAITSLRDRVVELNSEFLCSNRGTQFKGGVPRPWNEIAQEMNPLVVMLNDITSSARDVGESEVKDALQRAERLRQLQAAKQPGQLTRYTSGSDEAADERVADEYASLRDRIGKARVEGKWGRTRQQSKITALSKYTI